MEEGNLEYLRILVAFQCSFCARAGTRGPAKDKSRVFLGPEAAPNRGETCSKTEAGGLFLDVEDKIKCGFWAP